MFEALKAQIELEVARPPNSEGSGGTSFAVDVLIGHENQSKLPGANGRVIIAPLDDGEDLLGPSKFLNGTLRTLMTWQPKIGMSLWVPVGEAGSRVYLDRIDAIEALTRCVLRALYETAHGANLADRPVAESATVARNPRHLRHGEASLVVFDFGVPITKGRSLTQLPAGSSLAMNLRVNPES